MNIKRVATPSLKLLAIKSNGSVLNPLDLIALTANRPNKNCSEYSPENSNLMRFYLPSLRIYPPN